MKKKLTALFLLLVMVFTVFPWNAVEAQAASIVDSGKCGANATWKLDSEGTLTISGTGTVETNNEWWMYLTSVDRVYIEHGITKIGKNVFQGHYNLAEVVLAGSVVDIGDYAFSGCSASDFTISFPSSLISIGAYAFAESGLSAIHIPPNVDKIGDYAFSECDELQIVKIAEGVNKIGQKAFYYCDNLEQLHLPKSLQSIGEAAFTNCDSLSKACYAGTKKQWEQVQIGKGNTKITKIIQLASGENIQENPVPVQSVGKKLITVEELNDWFSKLYYNEKGFLIREEHFFDGAFTYEDIYTYDQQGKVLKQEMFNDFYSDGIAGIYRYDSKGNLIELDLYAPGYYTYEYDSNNRLIRSKAFHETGIDVTSYIYDNQGRVIQSDTIMMDWDEDDESKGTPYSKTYYYYNEAGKASRRVETYLFWDSQTEEQYYYYNNIKVTKSYDNVNDSTYTLAIDSIDEANKYAARYETYVLHIVSHEIETDSDGDIAKITATDKNGKKHEIVFTYSEYEPEYDLRVFSALPSDTIGVGQKINLLFRLYEDDHIKPIESYVMGISNPSVLDNIDTYDSNGNRIITLQGLKSGTSDVTFTDNTTGETVKITLNVEEQCGYYRCGSFPGVSNAIGQLFVNNGKCERHGDGTHTISFDAYNVGSAYGVVCVYNENGTLEKVRPIQPYNKSMGVGVEKLVNACKYIWSDIVNWNNKEISFYEKEGHSEHTKIVLEDISEGSEVVITTDAYQSDYVALYTGLDTFTQIISVLSDWDLQKNDQQKVTQRLLDAIVKAVSKDSAKEELRKKLVHDAAEDITTLTATFGSAKSMEELQEIIRNLSQELEIDVAEIIADTLKSMGYNLADGVVTAFFPAYKFSTLMDQMVGITWTMLDLLDNMRSGATEIHVMRHEITNMVTNGPVMVQQENNFSAETVLDTYVVVEADEMGTFNENVFESLTNYKVYNITLRENGVETQPDGKIKITIPIPENADARKCVVFRIEADGSRTVLTSSVEGGNIVFETDHLSYYVVGEDTTKVVEDKDNKYIIPVSIAVGIVLCVLVLSTRKRKKQTT